MGKFELKIRSRLENVEKIEFSEDFRWFLAVSCTNCREMYPNEIYLEYGDRQEADGTRGTFNFVSKCRFCSNSGTLNFVGSIGCYENSEDDQVVASLEGRGIKVVNWVLNSGFSVVSQTGKVFEDVKLDEGDWVEYDESGEFLVGVYEVNTLVCQV